MLTATARGITFSIWTRMIFSPRTKSSGNLRPCYAEGCKTVGFEIAEQLGWRLPQNIVVPMAGGSLITKIHKGFEELKKLGWVEPAPTKFFGAQATGCSPITSPSSPSPAPPEAEPSSGGRMLVS